MISLLRNFFIPKINGNFFLRLAVLALLTVLICTFILTPAFTHGDSMLPTYRSRQFLPVWRPKYWFRAPQVGDVVMVRFAGQRIMLLKRVVAVAGQRVAFHAGVLHIDGVPCQEPWSRLTDCDWELPERIVPEGEIYVIGDNRSMPLAEHIFGHVSVKRIVGAPLW